MVINIDFDGTVVTHDFPKVGKSIGAESVLKELVNNGHKLILFTMRSDKKEQNKSSDPNIIQINGQFLSDSIKWFERNDIPLYGIQTNPDQKLWTDSPKSYAELMIDDSAFGCPLKYDINLSSRPFVDWDKVRIGLIEKGLI